MSKTDKELHRDVVEELSWQPSITDSEIGVSVKDGVATLSGFVQNYAQKRAAERAVEAVAGVRAVAEELKVKLPGALARSDTEIAHQAANALTWDVEVPMDVVKVRVENGWLTLEGQVDWQYQRASASRAVGNLAGVRGVSNAVTLRAHASASDVSQRIEAALGRSADHSAHAVHVETRDGTVTLRGEVQSWAQRRDVEWAAWAAAGVNNVDDRTTVRF
ncbi:BON domain-containing protein [soil metagenome]|jgi:osmotically-inducible protein OsmY